LSGTGTRGKMGLNGKKESTEGPQAQGMDRVTVTGTVGEKDVEIGAGFQKKKKNRGLTHEDVGGQNRGQNADLHQRGRGRGSLSGPLGERGNRIVMFARKFYSKGGGQKVQLEPIKVKQVPCRLGGRRGATAEGEESIRKPARIGGGGQVGV